MNTDLACRLRTSLNMRRRTGKHVAGFRAIKQEIDSAQTQTRTPDAVTNYLNVRMAATTITWSFGAGLERPPRGVMPRGASPNMLSRMCAEHWHGILPTSVSGSLAAIPPTAAEIP
jgi:hypothetical protein